MLRDFRIGISIGSNDVPSGQNFAGQIEFNASTLLLTCGDRQSAEGKSRIGCGDVLLGDIEYMPELQKGDRESNPL